MKSPPEQYTDVEAHEKTEEFIKKYTSPPEPKEAEKKKIKSKIPDSKSRVKGLIETEKE